MSAESSNVQVKALRVPTAIPSNEWFALEGTYPEDEIWLKREDALLRQLYVHLETPANVTWWKGAAIVQNNGRVIAAVETQDDRHQSAEAFHAITNFERFEDYEVQLSKAKFLGIHNLMYRIPGELLFGARWTIRWKRDS